MPIFCLYCLLTLFLGRRVRNKRKKLLHLKPRLLAWEGDLLLELISFHFSLMSDIGCCDIPIVLVLYASGYCWSKFLKWIKGSKLWPHLEISERRICFSQLSQTSNHNWQLQQWLHLDFCHSSDEWMAGVTIRSL